MSSPKLLKVETWALWGFIYSFPQLSHFLFSKIWLFFGKSSFFTKKASKESEKIAQLVLNEVPTVLWEEVNNIGEIAGDRGGGFGSTGIK